jgi:hypothetical protein
VIEGLVNREGKAELLAPALAIVTDAIAESVGRGNAPDAAGRIYTELKKLLGLKRCGNTTDALMRDTLAPLITTDMAVYAELKGAIVDQLRAA